MTTFTQLTLEVPGIGVVWACVFHGTGWGSWFGDETLSNIPGVYTQFRVGDRHHPRSVVGRILRAAKEERGR